MKRILTLFALTFIYFTSSAQIGKSFIGITLGPSFPTGDFKSKDPANDKSGLANVGAFVDINYSYQFSKFVGITAALKGSINSVDISGSQMPSGAGGSMQVNATSWKTGAVLAGIYQTIPLSANEKLSLEFRELLGVQSTKSPEMNASIFIPGFGNFNAMQSSANTTSFVYSLGGGFRYQLNEKIGLKLFADYSSSKAKFDDIMISSGTETETVSNSQKINSVGLGIGLVIRL